MRALPFLIAALLISGCGGQRPVPGPGATVEEPPGPAASIETGNPSHAAQLKYGFHKIEQNAWRWTMRRFGVSLRPPPGSRIYGARLEMQFILPAPAHQLLDGLTLSATLNGRKLPPLKVAGEGNSTYSALVPKEALEPGEITVDFELSRAIPAGKLDDRELGLIVSSIGLLEP